MCVSNNSSNVPNRFTWQNPETRNSEEINNNLTAARDPFERTIDVVYILHKVYYNLLCTTALAYVKKEHFRIKTFQQKIRIFLHSPCSFHFTRHFINRSAVDMRLSRILLAKTFCRVRCVKKLIPPRPPFFLTARERRDFVVNSSIISKNHARR